MIHIKVPATTANMGPGFDCIGMAFKLYNNLWVEECEQELIIESKNVCNTNIHLGKTNLIYQSICRFYQEAGISGRIPGIKLIQEDYIPMTRGLGSSAACIVAGLMAANEISGIKLSKNDLCQMAAVIEGHLDNSTPALLGGITVGAMAGGRLEFIRFTPESLKELSFGVMIPDFPLSTDKARGVLPKEVSLQDAVFNISRAALMMAALINGDFEKLSVAMDDRLHQPYRLPLIPEMDDIFKQANKFGALGVFLSGAGSTLIAVYKNEGFVADMKLFLSNLQNKWDIKQLEPDYEGAVLYKM